MGGGRQVPSPPSGSADDPTLNFTNIGPLPDGAGYGCYAAPNLQIGTALGSQNLLSCDPGFYCPNLNQSDPKTLPVYCPPSAGCAEARLTNLPCSAQGKYEPIICKPGYYCPTFKEMYICPKGYYCPTGTVNPYKCDTLSSCPAGSVTQTVYGTIIVMILLDVIIAILILVVRYRQGLLPKFDFLTAGLGGIFMGPGYALKERAKRSTIQLNEQIEREAKILAEATLSPDMAMRVNNSGMDNGSIYNDGDIQGHEMRGQMRILVEAFHSALGSQDLRMNFRFENLALTLGGARTVLQGVTGEIRAKRMTAILGPSGAGKTTFMNVLMGKLNRTGGRLFINGEEAEMHLYRKIIGYVPQEDIMHRELTVRENLLHSARVRLPNHWSARQIEEHVDNVLKALKLTHVANSLIGDETSRGVSGGQRKRVNIGMEIAAAPLAILLDEPTSGLYSTAALDVAEILSNIAQLGLTIVAVIHQPRIEIFRKFDDVLMIAPGGRVAYLGPTALAQRYFEGLGYDFDPGSNASDTLMDILAGKGSNRRYNFTPDELVEAWENRRSRELNAEPTVVFEPMFVQQQDDQQGGEFDDMETSSTQVNYTVGGGSSVGAGVAQTRQFGQRPPSRQIDAVDNFLVAGNQDINRQRPGSAGANYPAIDDPDAPPPDHPVPETTYNYPSPGGEFGGVGAPGQNVAPVGTIGRARGSVVRRVGSVQSMGGTPLQNNIHPLSIAKSPDTSSLASSVPADEWIVSAGEGVTVHQPIGVLDYRASPVVGASNVMRAQSLNMRSIRQRDSSQSLATANEADAVHTINLASPNVQYVNSPGLASGGIQYIASPSVGGGGAS
ncbi:hypothetical protein HDU76_006985, partial [Blyttiomyces sp. JEL0837]